MNVKSHRARLQTNCLLYDTGFTFMMRGEGFPGWHLECSAMSMKYLGQTLDIHGGGLENTFPHHECEIAQSEAANELPFVRYWIHNNMVTVNGQKMGKSLGNFITLKDAFKSYHPLTIRFFILTTHYRSPLDYSNEALDAANKGLERMHNTVKNLRERLGYAKDDSTPGTSLKLLLLSPGEFSIFPELPDIKVHRSI